MNENGKRQERREIYFQISAKRRSPSSDENVDAREYRAISVTEHGVPERRAAATRSEDVILKQQAS